MIKKGLQIILDWNPTLTPNFGMVDFDQKEINALGDYSRIMKYSFAASIVNRHGLDGQINLETV